MYIDIDTEISHCAPCDALKPHQVKEPLQLHEISDLPWSFTAADRFDWHGKTQSAKHLLEKCYCLHTDIRAALLHFRNLPRDGLLKTRTFFPVTKAMLHPVLHTDVQEPITKQRKKRKDYYDRNAHQLPALKPGQTIRMQAAHGFDKLAIMNSPAKQPNSYAVTSQGAKFIRNRRHLLHVSESPPADFKDDLPVVTDTGALATPSNSEGSMQQPHVMGNVSLSHGHLITLMRKRPVVE
ncbi:hypothetical protein M9458_052934 [Cirrhinus mrigala]|uniref:Uncharacterized protein n=1 Tax=Cirrhinus mrigala TaxID=683832 RepID=A0ABD0MRK0_CIRMR